MEELKGFLIRVDFNFETKKFDFLLGFPTEWTVDFQVPEILVIEDKQVSGAILYTISSNSDAVDSNILIKYIKNVIKYNQKISRAFEKIEKQKQKLEQSYKEEGKIVIRKEIEKDISGTLNPQPSEEADGKEE